MRAEASAARCGESTGLRISTARSVAARRAPRSVLARRPRRGPRSTSATPRSGAHRRDRTTPSATAARSSVGSSHRQKKAATRSQSRGSVGADALPPRGRSEASAAREPPERTGCHATFAEGSRPSSRRRARCSRTARRPARTRRGPGTPPRRSASSPRGGSAPSSCTATTAPPRSRARPARRALRAPRRRDAPRREHDDGAVLAALGVVDATAGRGRPTSGSSLRPGNPDALATAAVRSSPARRGVVVS